MVLDEPIRRPPMSPVGVGGETETLKRTVARAATKIAKMDKGEG